VKGGGLGPKRPTVFFKEQNGYDGGDGTKAARKWKGRTVRAGFLSHIQQGGFDQR